jgi:rRNA biogenesis protein RRP5
LPNNLTGYVPVTSISDTLTRKVEKVASIDIESNFEEKEGDDDIELKSMFYLGQYLRASVVSTNDEPMMKTSQKSKRRIELSLCPQEANMGITTKELVPQSMVMASVVSVEDHGLIMDLGLLDFGVRGFMSSKEIGHNRVSLNTQEGAVFLCMITGLSSNGKIVKLSADTQKIANVRKSNYLVEGPTVDAFLPGTAVEFLISDITRKGITGKIMGMIDVTSDLIHSGAITLGKELDKKYKVGTKIRGRIICTFPTVDPRKLGISLLDHVMSLTSQKTLKDGRTRSPLDVLPLSTIVEEVIVKKVETSIGLFVDIGLKDVSGFVHISRVTDGKIDTLAQHSGPYQVGSKHRGRIIGYNALDGIYLASLEQKILEQAFLHVQDLKVGELVKGKVEKLIVNSGGIGGVLVSLADGITGLVPEMHMADVSLLHPEKKFKEGMAVTARVLSTDPSEKKIRLTLKKTLVNSEAPPIKSYADIAKGMQSPGTIVNILPSGAVVQFYGTVRGFLPISEMSESFIQDPSQHFRVGQVVNVHVLTVDVDSRKLTVSCKAPSVFGLHQQNAFNALKIGERISSTIASKSNDDVVVELEGSGLQAILPVWHLTDGSESKNASDWKKLRVGQSLNNLMVLDKQEQKRLIILTRKPSLIKAAEDQTLPQKFEDLRIGSLICGFVKNITLTGVFVQFGGGLTGLLPKSKLPDEALLLQEYGYKKNQSVTVRVHSLDQSQRRFLLSTKDLGKGGPDALIQVQAVLNPIDDKIKSMNDLTLGRLTAARIASIRETQLNVQLADNIQGRIDVSQVFDSWDDIKDRKHPLKNFASKQIIPVRILGVHDARNHRFLPISHRAGKTPVFELSAKPSDQRNVEREALTLDKVKTGTSWLAFVNNISEDCLWVNLSPNIRGRIRILDLSDDVRLLKDLQAHFPIGSAIKVHVIAVDLANNRLDLSARPTNMTGTLSLDYLSQNMVIPGKVTKVNERQLMVQLSDNVSGPVNLPDLADDFAEADPTIYTKNDIVSVCITEIDTVNKRIRLSTRPSRTLNSSLPVKDREITSVSQLKVNEIIRGFVKNVADNGIFVNLGGNVTAYIRVSDLSDLYLKDWKACFQVGQLVRGKVILADPILNHVQLSLKSSVIDKDYIPPITFNDLKMGQIVTGKIRKVEEFGVFIVVDGSTNVSGLCHRSEMAEGKVDNAKNLYEEGDAVKAKVLKVEHEKRRVSFGLKAAYFDHDYDYDQDSIKDAIQDIVLQVPDGPGNGDDEDGGVGLRDSRNLINEPEQEAHVQGQAKKHRSDEGKLPTLDTVGFDWTAGILDDAFDNLDEASTGDDSNEILRKHRRKPGIGVDMTGELDTEGPQSISDFERLLLGQPDSSRLWIEYMAFQTKLGELAKAREVAERALRTINIREETEKMNVWIALLNLENAYGSDDTVEETFKRACQYNDQQEIHERLTSIYIRTGKHVVSDRQISILPRRC